MNEAFLTRLGWSSHFSDAAGGYDPELLPGRVVMESRGFWRVLCDRGELLCRTSGSFFRGAIGQAENPVVGDWVLLTPNPEGDSGIIHQLLPRITRLARKAADTRTGVQVIAANIDIACIIQGLDENFNLRRLERYLMMVREGGATPLILLNKTDLHPDPEAAAADAATVAGGAPVLPLSALNADSLDTIRPFLQPGKTLCLLGSSGVGKSTLLNALASGVSQKVQEVRAGDSKGRHTTTVRQLFRLPGGALMIDTPGMRELQLWETGEVDETFPEIEALAASCRFNNCTHDHEPGCAVIEATERGKLSSDRLASYRKLHGEGSLLDKNRKQELAYKRRMEEKEIAKRRNELRRIQKPKKKK